MSDPNDRIGELIENPGRRADWRAFVASLHEATRPGAPLEGWLFHGTTSEVAESIEISCVTETECQVEAEGGWDWREGTHWGTPKVAAFYAEDRIESTDDPDLELAIVAVRVADLESCGDFAADGQTIDCPLHTRLERTESETDAFWEASTKDWRACLDAFGTLVVLGPVPGEDTRTLRGAADVEALIAEVSAAPRP